MRHAGGESLVLNGHAALITGIGRDAQAELEGVAGLQHHGAFREAADPNLGTLQVRQNAYVPTVMSCLTPDVLRDLCVIGLGAMTEIQPEHVHPRAQQAPDHVLTLTGRSDRRDDFGSAERVRVLKPLLGHGTESSFATMSPNANVCAIERGVT